MGVHKLWDLLTATALPVRVESVFGKVCCVDASFWISHCLASESNMRHGGDVIAVFFLRICYLLDKGIKPVFVFDGKSPFAKLRTILRRKLISQKSSTNHKLLAFKVLANQIRNKYKYKLKNDESINAVQPISEIESLFYNEPTNENPEDLNLVDLSPDRFVNWTEDELEEHIQVIKDCDLLNNKAKYDLINEVKDNIIQKDRETSMKLKDKMDEYSSHQIKSYMRDSKINKEIDKLKAEINSKYHPDQTRYMQFRISNSMSEPIYDYNEEFAPKYLTDFSQYHKKSPVKLHVKKETKLKTKIDYFDIDNEKYIMDDSVFATDQEIFGDELISGTEYINPVLNVTSNINQSKTLDKKEEMECDDADVKIDKIEESKSGNNENKALNHNLNQNTSNDYFLEMYRKYLLSVSKRELGENQNHSFSKPESETDECDSEWTPKRNHPTMSFNVKDYVYNDIKSSNSNSNTDGDQVNQVPEKEINENSDGGYFESSNECEDGDIDESQIGHLITGNLTYTKGEISESTEPQPPIKQERHQYYQQIQELLDCFGVPHIVAPGEAESQCAYMNLKGDCHAVISDDSDSLVFGAKCLLKNFYNDKVFELYTSERIEKELGIGRKQLALIAVICGCDYTNGVRGIGIVNALEVIKAYPNFEDLYEFKEWATNDTGFESATSDESRIREEYKKAHINYRLHWTFSPDFPNREAYNMFLNPKTTDDYELEWSHVNREGLEEFMSKKSCMPIQHVKECLNMLFTKKSQQFIMEDILPEITSKPVVKMAVKNYRKSLNTNLSAFRNVLSSIKSRKNYIFRINKALDRNHTLSKIRSKRMVDSIKTIKRRFYKR